MIKISRYSSIEEIKRDLIGYKNDFIKRQELDRLSSEVVSKGNITFFQEIKIMDFDFKNNKLIFKLNNSPTDVWIRNFQNPREQYSFEFGYTPENFYFQNNVATLGRVDEASAKRMIERFKSYIEIANRGFKSYLQNEAIKKENDLRKKLEAEKMDLDVKNKLLKEIKL